ncbi:MAG: tripartite tricarboxylate transporter substrate binding protein [Xanthobacteraceae bacterium]|jgi:tripartite-type tricarboxylate transporter receptor subunit TctC
MRLRYRYEWAVALILAALVATFGNSASSQTARTVRLVVPYTPGSGPDILARLVAEQAGRQNGPTVVVEDRPGAGTVIGTEAVARSAPDGNTVLMVAPSFIINPSLRKVNYDPLRDFEPICHLAATPMVIVVNAAAPYRSLADLLDAARAKPGELTLGSGGPGSSLHIGFEILKRAAGIEMTYVPYNGNAPAINALLGGHLTSVYADYPTVVEQLKAGALRALAVGSRRRAEALPDVPTVEESGFKDYDLDIWYGLVAPAKTPNDALAQAADWSASAVKTADIKPKLTLQGLYPVGICGAPFGAHLQKQYEDYERVIREAQIKAE